jgi:hypothetical protein
MTVSELLTRLSFLPHDMEVWTSDGDQVSDVVLAGDEGKQYVVVISGTEED